MATTTYSNADIADGDAILAPVITRAEDNIVAQANFTGIDGDVEVVFEQSLDNADWDGIKDANGEVFKMRLPKGPKPKGTGRVTANLVGFYATYLRAKVYVENATEGMIDELIINA